MLYVIYAPKGTFEQGIRPKSTPVGKASNQDLPVHGLELIISNILHLYLKRYVSKPPDIFELISVSISLKLPSQAKNSQLPVYVPLPRDLLFVFASLYTVQR